MLRTLTFALAFLFLAFGARAETFAFTAQGFSLKAPDGWRVISVGDAVRMVERSDFGDELKRAGNPASQLLAVAREIPVDGVSPGVFVNYHAGTISDIGVGLDRVSQILARNLREFQMLQPPTLTRLGPYEAGRVQYRYTTEVGAGDAVVIETFWLIPDGDHYATISGGLAPKDEATAQPLIEAMARSMKPL